MNRQTMIGIICGMVLGDASLIKPAKGKNAYLSMIHCAEQEKYLDYKIEILSQLCGAKKAYLKMDGKERFRCWTKCHPVYTQLRDWFYRNGKKEVSDKILYRLNPQGLALWYMDDGYLAYIKKNGKIRGREIKIYSQGFSKKENERIIDFFNKKYGLKWRIGRSKAPITKKEIYHIATGAENGLKFFDIIGPYVPDSMNYKLDMKYHYSSYAGRPFNWAKIQSELGSNVKTMAEMTMA